MSESTARRRSTVYDFSTLRLHPNGSRVAIKSPTRSGLCDTRTRTTGRDTHGNRVARDAAGLGKVPKRPVIRESDTGEDNDDGGGDVEVQNIKPRMPSHRKRRRIDDNVEFLGDSRNGARHAGDTAIAKNEEMMSWPVPSSDLLKCVHHFASQYYAAHGLLSDRSRMYRRELRRRKARVGAVQTTDADAEVDADADDPFVDDDDDDDENVSDKEDHCEESIVKGQEKGEGEGLPAKSVPDMYKAFDGSALMAIGMLLQEHVSMLLRPNMPPGWEEEMEAAGLIPEDGSTVSEDEGIAPDGDSDMIEDAESDKSDDEEILVESVSSDTN